MNVILTELMKPSPFNTHEFTSWKVKNVRKDKDGFKREDNSNVRWSRGKDKGKHVGSGNSRANAYFANSTSLEDCGCSSADAYQAHDVQAGFGNGDEEEAPNFGGEEKTTHFSICYLRQSLCLRG